MTGANALYLELMEMGIFDVHTHMDASHICARGLDDILLYHMVISDLYSAGCPDGARLPESPSPEEREARIERAIPYLPLAANTSCLWGMRLILKDLYEWDEPVTLKNWRELDARIAEKSRDHAWARSIQKKANILRYCTELWRGRNGEADDLFQYSLEWAFFTRLQWGHHDAPLLELENAWAQDEPGAPLAVTADAGTLSRLPKVRTLDDVEAAMAHYVGHIPYERILSIASHFSTDIVYRKVSAGEMVQALVRRDIATAQESNVYANYLLQRYLDYARASGRDLMQQFSIGAEPLPFESSSKLRVETLSELSEVIAQHPEIRFCFFLSNAAGNQAICTMARELPNLSVAGYWWHNFFPAFIRRVMEERLDMLPVNKQIGFFSDAYCIDWSYAKSVIVRKQLAQVLSQKVEMGQYSAREALEIARQILVETPRRLLSMTEFEGHGEGKAIHAKHQSAP